jgi:hypothetical protein
LRPLEAVDSVMVARDKVGGALSRRPEPGSPAE